MRRGMIGGIQNRLAQKALPKAWVMFKDPASIQDSFGVSSLTNTATGQYLITFARPFGYAAGATGYAVCVLARAPAGATALSSINQTLTEGNAYNVNSVSVYTSNSAAGAATDLCSVMVFGP